MNRTKQRLHRSAYFPFMLLALFLIKTNIGFCAAPSLPRTDKAGLWNDGVTPDYGIVSSDSFTFKVIYTDSDNDAPFRESIQNGRPEEQLLEKYDEIKKEEDPEMPCAEPAEGECPCFSEGEFRAMRDGFRDVEPYDEITTMLKANGDVEGEWFRAYGGEVGENGDGTWTWIERSTGGGIGVFMSGCRRISRC